MNKYKNLIFIITVLLLSIILLFMLTESLYKALFLLFLVLSYLLLGIKTGSFTKTSILYIFFVLPFNITYQLSEYVQLFNYNFHLYDPYVTGLYVNYLVPTLSVIDIFVFMLLISIFFEHVKTFNSVFRNLFIIIFVVFLILQNVFVQDFNTLFLTLRLLLYFVCAISIVKIIKDNKEVNKLLQTCYINLLLTGQILTQLFISIYQFVRGTSVGLNWLGESKIINGMLGSSYIDIKGDAYLRAYGTFPHPNLLAGWLLLLFVISWICFRANKYKYISLTNMLFISIVSILTFSRVSLILLLILLVIFIITEIVSSKDFNSFTGILLTRFLNLFNGSDSSLKDRVELLKIGWSLFKKNFVLGTGMGNSIKEYSDSVAFTSGGFLLLQPVHNIFLLSLIELGILGGIYYWFLIIKFFVIKNTFNIVKYCILVIIIIVGLFDHYFFSLPQGLTMLFVFLTLLSY